MTTYWYQAYDAIGSLLEGQVDADSLEKARDLVRQRGITPFRVEPQRTMAFFGGPSAPRKQGMKVDDVKLAGFVRDLSVLLEAGVPLETALRIAETSAADKAVREMALRLLEGVLSGAMLASVMSGLKEFNRQEYVEIVQAGEHGGDLGGALKEMADLLDRRIEIRSRLRSALAYPIMLIGLAVVSMVTIMGVLLPSITPIFSDNGQPLPPAIAAFEAIRSNWAWIIGAGGAVVAIFVSGLGIARRDAGLRSAIDRLYLKTPLLGSIVQMREAARFFRTLATLVRAGVPMLQALVITNPLVKNQFMRNALERVRLEVSEGTSLSDAIARTSAIPRIAIPMITVGEETGRLREMLQRAAIILDRQEQDRTARILAILGPAVTIGVAAMIAVLILSVVSGILAINELALK
jgi:general secretion pathway protein F